MIRDIWQSFCRIPVWVQIWIVLILVPVNLLAIGSINNPYGTVIAILAVGGMVPNLAIMAWERGVSKRMALPHLIAWIPLVVLIPFAMAETQARPVYFAFLWVLFVVDVISLGFDIVDFRKWLNGDRDVA